MAMRDASNYLIPTVRRCDWTILRDLELTVAEDAGSGWVSEAAALNSATVAKLVTPTLRTLLMKNLLRDSSAASRHIVGLLSAKGRLASIVMFLPRALARALGGISSSGRRRLCCRPRTIQG